jgi:hypothetical protein
MHEALNEIFSDKDNWEIVISTETPDQHIQLEQLSAGVVNI